MRRGEGNTACAQRVGPPRVSEAYGFQPEAGPLIVGSTVNCGQCAEKGRLDDDDRQHILGVVRRTGVDDVAQREVEESEDSKDDSDKDSKEESKDSKEESSKDSKDDSDKE